MNIDIHSLDSAHRAAAFDLATRVFVEESTLHRALGIGLEEYRAYLHAPFGAMVEEGLSVMAVEDGMVCGCLIVTDFHGAMQGSGTPPPRFAPLVALTDALCARYRVQGAGEVVLGDIAAVAAGRAGRGLYRRMREAAQDIARARGYRRFIGELSSAATQHVVLETMGHRKVAEIAFADFEYKGMRPFRDIAEPRGIVLAEGKLR